MWVFQEAARVLTIDSVFSDVCIFCKCDLLRLPAEKFEKGRKLLLAQLSICRQCGWWSVYRIHQGEYEKTTGICESHSGTIGCLKELDISDISTPLDEVRKYFLAKREVIFDVHPRILEEVVADVFRDAGYTARVTAYSGDGGIDVILDGDADCTIGVQVKRNKRERKIEAEQIRSLAGALILGGHTKGIFVTTSGFRKGAIKTAEKYKLLGRPIELIDAERFLNILGIVQMKSFELDQKQIASYIVTRGVHIGTGLEQVFSRDEDLRERNIVVGTWTRSELIEMSTPHNQAIS